MGKVAFVPMMKEHLPLIRVQKMQDHIGSVIDAKSVLIYPGLSWTGLVGGVVLGCAGVYPVWYGRAFVWAFLSEDFGNGYFLQTHRFVHLVLAALQKKPEFKRLECTVKGDHQSGHRWMKLLGFALETPDGMSSYSPEGEKFFMYSRVS